MSRQLYAVAVAPGADVEGEGVGKPAAHMVVKAVSGLRYAVGKLPDEFGYRSGERCPVGFAEAVFDIVGPGKSDVPVRVGVWKRVLEGHLRLVGKDRGHYGPEFIAHRLVVFLVSHLDEAVDSRLVHEVRVGIAVVSRIVLRRLDVCVPDVAVAALSFVKHSVVSEKAVWRELHRKPRNEPAAGVAARGYVLLVMVDSPAFLVILIRPAGEEQVPYAVFFLLCDEPSGESRRPPVLVVEPGEHLFFFGLAGALLNQVHEFVAEIFGLKAGPHVHVESAEAHFLQYLDLAFQFFSVEPAVPRPERRAAVFGRRILKEPPVELLC